MAGELKGISTHVLDVAIGRPAAGITVRLARRESQEWVQAGVGSTSADGRCSGLLGAAALAAGEYRLIFETGAYFKARGSATIYPEVIIQFFVHDPCQHYHLPLLLAANGYTTYRGS